MICCDVYIHLDMLHHIQILHYNSCFGEQVAIVSYMVNYYQKFKRIVCSSA